MNISGSLRYFIGLAFKSLWQDRRVHFQSIFSLYLVLMCILSLLFLSQNLQQTIANMASQVQISVYMDEKASSDDIEQMKKAQCRDDFIDTCNIISQNEAKKRFLDSNPNLKATIEHLQGNPFPSSIEILIKKDFSDETALQRKIQYLETLSLVEEVVSDQVLAKKWFTILKILKWALAVVICFSFLVLLGITSHVVGLLTYMKQKQIEIMSLIGATDAMVAITFMTCAVMNSLIALFLALLSFALLVTWLQDYLQNALNMPWISLSYFNTWVLLFMAVFAFFIGSIGGYLGVKRFLK
ncbi:MAG TPA: permease-like cell division protein FtsX [Oligoflexia bacterium]|nr:permease-like cell division protein FtsX [Oligoflexia bacterium]HMR24590.1 permease-like cell division protein FtsX [Oligoflexia bacterium]